MSHKRSAIGVLTGLVAWGLAVPISGTASAAPIPGAASTSTVTLFTGDKVTLGGQHGATVEPAKGRERTRFHVRKDARGDLHVIPVDTEDMLRAKRLDPRLFNVSQLVKDGYSDQNRKDIPLIVSGGTGRAAKIRDLPSVGGAAVSVDKATGLDFKTADKIWLDGPVRASLDKSVPQVGAPEAWNAGFTGKDTTVAVLDTGIDATHPDLADAVVKAENFTDAATGPDDHYGHGTHVASIVTGKHEKYQGVAPDTKLLNGKVLDDSGNGSESWIIAGMEWAAEQGADVVNLSLGTSTPSDGTDPMSQAVNRITAETGTLFVISAGNSGDAPGSPGAADAALTVGAVDHDDQLADFSSRGPRLGDDAIKPDITAPGVEIAAAKGAHGGIGTPVDAGHVRLSGTSMAAPHVAGAAAILAQQHPDWKAEQLKAALMGSAKPNPALSVFHQGAGRLDVARAVQQATYAVPASINGGVAQWPHNDDTPIKKTVTYHNSGSTPVTANLTAALKDPAGNPAPAGMITFAQNTITIPAGGQAQTEVIIDTRVAAPDGRYTGSVNAGDLSTPIAVNREVESYNVTLRFLDMDGKPTNQYETRFIGIDEVKEYRSYNESGTVVVRLPKGRYYLHSRLGSLDDLTLATEPEYVVSRDSELVVDARTGKPFGFAVDKPNAKAGFAIFDFVRRTPLGIVGDVYLWSGFDGVRVTPSTTTSAPKQFAFTIEGKLAEPDGKGGFFNSPYLYSLYNTFDDKVPAQPVARVKDSDLAKVRSEHAATEPGKFGQRDRVVVRALPYSLDEFYTPDYPWYGTFSQQADPDRFASPDTYLGDTTGRTFKRGQTTTERWNFGVFGPAFGPDMYAGQGYAARWRDIIYLNIGTYTDQVRARSGRTAAAGTMTLSQDGKEIGRADNAGSGIFTVPSGTGTLQLHSESISDLALSGKVSTDWTFKSATPPTEDPAALPLTAVRFAPALDNQNRAPRVIPTVVPVNIDHNTGGKAKLTSIQVSHDEGATWQPAPVLCADGRVFTLLVHPAGAKTVSLKASARDNAGNSVSQTILRAFHLK